MAHVYWIHLLEHTDMFTEGYVGVTTIGVAERFKRHVSASKVSGRRQVINNAILKHGASLRVDTVVEAEEAYCYWVESKLRARVRIGWNIAIGGESPGAGRKNSLEHIAKVAVANRGLKRSPEQVEAMRGRMKEYLSFDYPWQHPYSNKTAWQLASEIYAATSVSTGLGARSISKMYGISRDVAVKLLTKFREGWVPDQDCAYVKWKQSFKEAICQPTA